MERKKIILIAVLINAGLLAVLFVTALTTKTEGVQEEEFAQNSQVSKEERSLAAPVQNSMPEFSLTPSSAPLAKEASAPNSLPASPPAQQEPIVHTLPPLEPLPMELPISPATPPLAPAPARAEAAYLEVIVRRGDSLEKIAKAYHTTVDEIIRLNHLPSSFLKIGQPLKVPLEKNFAAAPKLKPMAPQERTAGPEYYTVKVGDNPWTIAMKHHMKVEELLKLNGLNEEKARKLKPGDRLRIR